MPDRSEHCEGWAFAGECSRNPGYMLSQCKASCDQYKQTRASFAVATYDELVVVHDNFTLTRVSPASRGRDMARRSLEECPSHVCGCLAHQFDQFFTTKLKELELERRLFESSVRIVPTVEAGGVVDTETAYRTARAIQWPSEVDCLANLEHCVDLIGEAAKSVDYGLRQLRAATKLRSEAKRNATCGAVDAQTTYQDNEPSAWFEGRAVRDLFWHPDVLAEARISIVEDFVTADECDAMINEAMPRLTRATHANNGDFAHISNARDAQQATLTGVSYIQQRAVDLANFLSNYSMDVTGQERLMAIQYKAGQQYMLHCDGSCDGTPYEKGGRLATVLIYCRLGEGGATAFPNADVFVSPQVHSAVYFHFSHYGYTENWHTEHSGCPVTAGEKWVVTQWLRAGVDAQHPASSFSPFGGPISA